MRTLLLVVVVIVSTTCALNCSDNAKGGKNGPAYNDPKILTLGGKGASVRRVTNSSVWSCMESISSEDRQQLTTITFSDVVQISEDGITAVEYGPVHSIEPGAFSWFASAPAVDVQITTLVLDCNRVAEIVPGSLNGLHHLRSLQLQGNAISSLHGSAIPPSVQKLDLSHNMLKSISSDTFQGLGNLQFLKLSSNDIAEVEGCGAIDIAGATNAFSQLRNLATLSLDRNLLSSISGNCFRGLGHLFTLDLSSNEIETIQMTSFSDHLPQLATLNLAYNQLNTINGTRFRGLSCLSLLVMSANPVLTVTDQEKFLSISNNFGWQSQFCCNGTPNAMDQAACDQIQRRTQTNCSMVRKCLPFSTSDNQFYIKESRSYSAWLIEAVAQRVPNFDDLLNDTGVNHSSLLVMTNSKRYTRCDTTVGAHLGVHCTCGKMHYLVSDVEKDSQTERLWSPANQSTTNQSCFCPLGFYSDNNDDCIPCPRGTFGECNQTTPECTCTNCSKSEKCDSHNWDECTTPRLGTATKSSCELSEAARRAREYAADSRKRFILLLACAVLGVVIVVLFFLAYCHWSRSRKRTMELEFQNQELQNIQTKLELNYYKDWRIDQTDITLVRELASGGEGTAWLGTKRGHLGQVVVKVKHATAEKEPVWEEREVVRCGIVFMLALSVLILTHIHFSHFCYLLFWYLDRHFKCQLVMIDWFISLVLV